jgi:hypothetical protein
MSELESAFSPEEQLVLLLCSTKRRQMADHDMAVEMLERCDRDHFLELLIRCNLLVLVGRRALALAPDLGARFSDSVDTAAAIARPRGIAQELSTIALLARLEQQGIAALPLKGATLSKQLYADVSARNSVDIDILVPAGEMDHAVEVIEAMGWSRATHLTRSDGLPVLHETMVHPEMPRVELHWRVHWYESRFAADALARAQRPRVGEPLQLCPQDGLAALILVYARDGFIGLRIAADAAAWWDSVCLEGSENCGIESLVASYPLLEGPLSVGSALLSSLLDVPIGGLGRAPARWRLAAALAAPFFAGARAQQGANASLVDLLLAPPNGLRDWVGREALMSGGRARRTGALLRFKQAEHLLRVTRRWILALASALRALPEGDRKLRGREPERS